MSYKGKTVQIIRNYSNKKTPKESNVANELLNFFFFKFKRWVFQQSQPKELSEDCIGNQKTWFLDQVHNNGILNLKLFTSPTSVLSSGKETTANIY